jgi:hypothetical protein
VPVQALSDPSYPPVAGQGVFRAVSSTTNDGYWFWGRPSFYDLWRDLRAATSEVRPDWDLSKPGLRAAWDADDWSLFHGGDRRSGKPPGRL